MTPSSTTETTPPRWPWALLALALTWVALVRVPLIVHAATHLDSDLAVDGLTLIDALHGHWRWHFPGTPHMGTFPLLLLLPQAAIWGATPSTLVSGGVLAYAAVVVATFLLAWRVFGPKVAAWGLVPLAFASTGTVWLSGRLTGGHLLTLAWHAGAFGLLAGYLARGGILRAAVLGFWCGLGLSLDRMFLFSLLAVVPTALIGRIGMNKVGPSIRVWLVIVSTISVGYAPHVVGMVVDPYDAYQEQFAPILVADVLQEHAKILAFDCLPRLIAGHRLPGLQSEPSPSALGLRVPTGGRRGGDALDALTTVVALALFAASLVALAVGPPGPPTRAARAVRWGVLGSSAGIAVAFVLNRNIFNSDNYRYLVFLLVPWSLGFGLLAERLARGNVAWAAMVGLLLAGLLTVDTARWYEGFGWLGAEGPGRRPSPALARLSREPSASHIFGDYWDVYKLSFLSGGRVQGVPYPIYPNRFPGWSRGLGPGRGAILVPRNDRRWPGFLRAAWQADGRDPAELGGVTILDRP
jgi:hypothetical protein